MFGTHTRVVADTANPWKVPTHTEAPSSAKRRSSRGGFAIGVLSSAALVAGFIGITSTASAASSPWTLFNYNSNGNALKSSATPSTANTASFDFAPGVYTAALTTDAKALTGDLTGKTMNATVAVTSMTGGATFLDQNGGGCTPDTQTVRLYLTTAGTGSVDPISPRGFYTTFWWSNPVAVALTNDGGGTMSVAIDPANWSDWNGQSGTAVSAAFATAVSKVTSVGLSFGGGCFFENGVATSDGKGTFAITDFSVTP